MRSTLKWVVVTVMVAAAGGCATRHAAPPAPAYGAQHEGAQHGVVHSIDMVRAENQTSGAGAVVGGALGAVLGRQVGGGSGRDAATVVGVLAGAIMGNEIEKNRRGATDIYRVTVRVERGGLRSFDYASLNDLRVGDRVRIENDQLYRW